MAELDRRYEQTVGRADVGAIDEGLRSYMLRVYNYMASGVAITGVVAYVIYSMSVVTGADGSITGLTSFGNLMYASAFKWIVIFAPLAMVFFLSFKIQSLSVGTAQMLFWLFSALMGASISSIFLVYAGESIARVFFITAGAFAATSLYGYTTKKDLTAMGRFLTMATFGILIAIVVNLFLQSSGLHLLMSIVVPLIFAGLTAYETQQIKSWYYEGDLGDVTHRKAIFGAFLLYGSFVTMFVWLMQLFGVARD